MDGGRGLPDNDEIVKLLRRELQERQQLYIEHEERKKRDEEDRRRREEDERRRKEETVRMEAMLRRVEELEQLAKQQDEELRQARGREEKLRKAVAEHLQKSAEERIAHQCRVGKKLEQQEEAKYLLMQLPRDYA